MTYTVWAERLETADLAGSGRVFQTVSFDVNTFLRAVRAEFVAYGSPTLTGLALNLHELKADGSVGPLIAASSKSYSRADLSAETYAAKEVWFEYATPPFLRAGDTYALVPAATSYTATEANHIALARAWPATVPGNGYTPEFSTLAIAPFKVLCFAHEVRR